MSSASIAAPSIPELVRRWQAGWGLAKGLWPAQDVRGGLRVPIGQPNRHVEIIAVDADSDEGREALRGLAEEVVTSRFHDWLTVPTAHPDEAEKILRAAGLELLDRPEWLMTIPLERHPAGDIPAGYTVATVVDGTVAEARVVEDRTGEVAAHGLMAVSGCDAVAHNVATEPGHRRRGLARVVMGTLVREAVERGATTGLLIASEDGQQLYATLGWEQVATVLIANTPETTPSASGTVSEG